MGTVVNGKTPDVIKNDVEKEGRSKKHNQIKIFDN